MKVTKVKLTFKLELYTALILSFFVFFTNSHVAICGKLASYHLIQSNWQGKEVACKLDVNKKSLIFLTKEKDTWKPLHKYPTDKIGEIVFLDLSTHGQIILGYKKYNKRYIRILEVRNTGLLPIKTEEVSLLPNEVQVKNELAHHKLYKKIVPKISFSPHHLPFSSPSPAHILITDEDKNMWLRVYPLKEYINMWLNQGDLTIKISVSRIKRYLKSNISKISPPLEIIPPRPGLNDFALFIEKIPFKNGKGIGFVGRIATDIDCVSPNQLKYFFIGITDDEKFIVSFESKLNLKRGECPKKLWECKKDVFGIKKQIEGIKRTLPLCNHSFKPAISTIKNFLNSISINAQ